MEKIGILAGSFDPITNGHLYVVEKALDLVGRVVIVVAANPSKKTLFSKEERCALIETCLRDAGMDKRAEVVMLPDDELLVSFADSLGAKFVFRGLRNLTDFAYEQEMNLVQKKVSPHIETVFFMTPRKWTEVSSSLVKAVVVLKGGKDVVADYVPFPVLNALIAKLQKT